MKKYILYLTLALVSFSSYAQLTSNTYSQNTVRMKTTLTSSVDSVVVTNTGTGHLYQAFTAKDPQSIQALITIALGTGAGTMTLYGSNDGVNWEAATDATSTPTVIAYTVTNAGTYAAPQLVSWDLGFHKYLAYRLTWVGSGTMVGRFKAIIKYH